MKITWFFVLKKILNHSDLHVCREFRGPTLRDMFGVPSQTILEKKSDDLDRWTKSAWKTRFFEFFLSHFLAIKILISPFISRILKVHLAWHVWGTMPDHPAKVFKFWLNSRRVVKNIKISAFWVKKIRILRTQPVRKSVVQYLISESVVSSSIQLPSDNQWKSKLEEISKIRCCFHPITAKF